jgi:hypothetical protein
MLVETAPGFIAITRPRTASRVARWAALALLAAVVAMPFPVGQGTSLKGIAVGDKIEASLVVDWDQGFMELQRITKLPRETTLHFGKARQAGNSTARSDLSNPEKQP